MAEDSNIIEKENESQIYAPYPPPDLITALKNGKAIAIIGSGLSLPCGGPTWKELLYGILAEACETCPSQKDKIKIAFQAIQENRHQDAAGLLKEVLGPTFTKSVVRQIEKKRELKVRKVIKETSNLIDAIFEKCGPPTPRIMKPSVSHRIIMQLPFHAIITTNFDRLLEDAAPKKKLNAVFSRSFPYLASRVKDSPWFMIKIHGCIDTHEDIILSRDDYKKPLFSQPIRQILQSLFDTSEKFWIGYGHNDPTLDLLIDESREILNLSSGFSLAKRDDSLLEARFKSVAIQPIWIDNYSLIPLFLRNLANAVDSDLVFEVLVNRKWGGMSDAELHAKELNSTLNASGGNFEIFTIEERPNRIYLETKASKLADYRQELATGKPYILGLLRSFDVIKFDGIEVESIVPIIEDSIFERYELLKADPNLWINPKDSIYKKFEELQFLNSRLEQFKYSDLDTYLAGTTNIQEKIKFNSRDISKTNTEIKSQQTEINKKSDEWNALIIESLDTDKCLNAIEFINAFFDKISIEHLEKWDLCITIGDKGKSIFNEQKRRNRKLNLLYDIDARDTSKAQKILESSSILIFIDLIKSGRTIKEVMDAVSIYRPIKMTVISIIGEVGAIHFLRDTYPNVKFECGAILSATEFSKKYFDIYLPYLGYIFPIIKAPFSTIRLPATIKSEEILKFFKRFGTITNESFIFEDRIKYSVLVNEEIVRKIFESFNKMDEFHVFPMNIFISFRVYLTINEDILMIIKPILLDAGFALPEGLPIEDVEKKFSTDLMELIIHEAANYWRDISEIRTIFNKY